MTSKKQKEIPNQYLCPITLDIMKDPVICSDGYTYERESILSLKNNLSPMTRQKIDRKNLIPNLAIKQLIQEFIVKNNLRETNFSKTLKIYDKKENILVIHQCMYRINQNIEKEIYDGGLNKDCVSGPWNEYINSWHVQRQKNQIANNAILVTKIQNDITENIIGIYNNVVAITNKGKIFICRDYEDISRLTGNKSFKQKGYYVDLKFEITTNKEIDILLFLSRQIVKNRLDEYALCHIKEYLDILSQDLKFCKKLRFSDNLEIFDNQYKIF